MPSKLRLLQAKHNKRISQRKRGKTGIYLGPPRDDKDYMDFKLENKGYKPMKGK